MSLFGTSSPDEFLEWEANLLQKRSVRSVLWIVFMVSLLSFGVLIVGRTVGSCESPFRQVSFVQAFAATVLPCWVVAVGLERGAHGANTAMEGCPASIVLLRILLTSMVIIFMIHQSASVAAQFLGAAQ